MKLIVQFLLISILLNACGSNKSYLERSDEKKALFDAVKKLNKNPSDKDASNALPILYASILKNQQAKIKSYETGNDLARWDKIIYEYEGLQDVYNSIINSTPAFKLVTPENFTVQIMESKERAAADYYATAESYFVKNGRDNAKQAYHYFEKTNQYVPGYKDVEEKLNAAYENGMIDVVINSLQDNSYFNSSGWGSTGLNYTNDYFQRTLVRDLSVNKNNTARFFSDWEAQRQNVAADWTVDIRIRNMDIPQPTKYNYSRNRSAQIQNGTDTSGKPIYKTVQATVYINRMSFTAFTEMDVVIKDLISSKNISNQNFRDEYRWQEEKASYSGDSKALTPEDWSLINNGNFNTPRKEEIIEDLYKKIYPRILNNIQNKVAW